MATNFPSSLDDSTTIPAESANTKLSTNHVTAHQNIQDAIEAIEAKVGANSSAVTTSHDYKLSEVTDKAVGKTATQTLTNKTLTSPVINLGSDAEGDTYYRNSSGALTRLARGTDNYIYKMNGNVPNWEAEASNANASTTVAGIVELATSAQVTAGTATGETGAALVVTPDALAASAPVFNGSGLTNLTNPAVYKNGTTTKNVADASGTQTIAHGLGKAPKYVRFTYVAPALTGSTVGGTGVYNGTTVSNVYNYNNTSPSTYNVTTSSTNVIVWDSSGGGTALTQVAVPTYDATNITLTWTRSAAAPSGTFTILWEAFA
jgi:hypothetical protein